MLIFLTVLFHYDMFFLQTDFFVLFAGAENLHYSDNRIWKNKHAPWSLFNKFLVITASVS